MRYFNKRRIKHAGEVQDDDPMTGVANLFDVGLVFIVGLIMALFSVYHLQDLFSETSSFTIVKKSHQSQEMEIITKEGKRIKAMKVTRDRVQGRGQRLGIAYKLEDGTMVYVPE